MKAAASHPCHRNEPERDCKIMPAQHRCHPDGLPGEIRASAIDTDFFWREVDVSLLNDELGDELRDELGDELGNGPLDGPVAGRMVEQLS
jgi:hypothetical protein